MGFELPNGKTARNIQEQVAFITEKVKELFAAVGDLGFKIVKVEELPEEGAARTIYLVPSDDPEEENAFNEYLWIEDGWELIGSTAIDLSNYVDLTSAQTISGNKYFSGVASFIGGANFNGPIKTSFYPETSNSYDLGFSDYTWRNIYLSNGIYLTANWYIHESTRGIIYLENVGQNTGLKFERDILFPETPNYTSLGTQVKKFKNLYLSGEISDGTNAAIVADIAALITYAKAQGWIS